MIVSPHAMPVMAIPGELPYRRAHVLSVCSSPARPFHISSGRAAFDTLPFPAPGSQYCDDFRAAVSTSDI
ncbi:hypothetical protein DM02DRAFT_612442 [Periconia macrospinosa]|uniref:Uncharacterized protein n=1 Tax=Periconia macrospinosa TaxID=97972 RepID=A0A2V1DXZ4_9PLEO|nr:hypothetical protein DM02DRAFT_612442 [Periconia macrospinosa]